MTKSLVSAMVLAALAGTANAQSMVFQIVERNNQHNVAAGGTAALNNDAVLDFAVQAKVTSTDGSFLGGFGFNVAAPGEADTRGVLRHGVTMDPDAPKAYFADIDAAFTPIPTVGVHGLPYSYLYLANINNAFDGVINTDSGVFVNTPGAQEIGLITGAALGNVLLGTPGVDGSPLDGNPNTWSGNNGGVPPTEGATAPMNPTIGAARFAEGAFVDIFRFRYTVTDFNARTFDFTLQGLTAQIANAFLYSNSQWGLNSATFSGATITPWTINVTPAPASAALLGLGGLVAARRRRQA